MATSASAIEPLDGSRQSRSIRLIVAGTEDYRRRIADALARDAVSLVDLAETEQTLFDKIEREEFDCVIADQTFAGRGTLELREKMEQRFDVPPATILLTDAPSKETLLKAFRNGVSDVVAIGPALAQELAGAVRRAVERNRKHRNLYDEIAHLSKLARYDSPTGIPNSNFLEDRLTSLVAGAYRRSGKFAVLMIGLNNFEEMTDVYGHAIGDQTIRAFARQLMQASRTSDAFGRLGGNEFLYLIDRDVSAATVEQACARLSKALAFAVEMDTIAIALTASIGAALFPADGEDIDGLLNSARYAMQAARAAGGGYHVPHTLRITLEGAAPEDSNSAASDTHQAGTGDREANRRSEHRERVLRRGRIILGDGFSTIDCIIRDISPHGARFTVQEGIAVPRTLSLAILDTGRARPAIRRWQRGPSIGVEFTAEVEEQRGDKAA